MTYETLNHKRLQPFKSQIEKPSHDSMNVRLKFAENSIQYKKLYEVYEKVADPELLIKCIDHKTQNPNESFHMKIWKICPKVSYSAYPIMQFSLCQNILYHHLGYKDGNLMKEFDVKPTKDMETVWAMQESSRTRFIGSKPKRPKIEFKLKRNQNLQKQQQQYQGVYKPGAGKYSWPQ